MILKLTNINYDKLQSYENDILLNKKLTNISPSNMYEILFNCPNFNTIFDLFLNEIKKTSKDLFDVYVKNMWGYIQTSNDTTAINFTNQFKSQVTISSEYSFIYLIKSNISSIFIKNDKNIQNIILTPGDLLIFKTSDFIKDENDTNDRIALIGSISNIKNINKVVKKILI